MPLRKLRRLQWAKGWHRTVWYAGHLTYCRSLS